MGARLKTPQHARSLTREECVVETVLGIIGGATVIEDGIERQIDPHDIHGVLCHLREACLATQRIRARQSKQQCGRLSNSVLRYAGPTNPREACPRTFVWFSGWTA